MADACRGLRIVLFGPPGVGKGTQAAEIVKRTGVAHISTGDMLREAMREDSPLGRKVRSVVERGDLVPDDLVGELVVARLGRDDARQGFLLDGYPRTVPQARFLDEFLAGRGEAIDAVVNLDVPKAEILDRLTGRRVCGQCGATYHALHNKPRVEGRCNACGGALAQRSDDGAETVTERLRVYAARTAPVLDHFRAAGALVSVDGTGRVEQVLARIAQAVPGILGMIIYKSRDEMETMDRCNRVVVRILEALARMVKPGVTTMDLDREAEKMCKEADVKPAFKGYRGYPRVLCASVNEEVVHGIPSATKVLSDGDIIGLDFGVVLGGYYGDAAITVPVGRVSREADTLMRVTRESLYKAIDLVRPGKRLSDISAAIQQHVEARGFSVVREFVGHGIGTALHEDPQVPNYGTPGSGPVLKEGLVVAIEPMVNAGGPGVRIHADGWTASTMDGSLSAHFERSVAVTENGPWILGGEAEVA